MMADVTRERNRGPAGGAGLHLLFGRRMAFADRPEATLKARGLELLIDTRHRRPGGPGRTRSRHAGIDAGDAHRQRPGIRDDVIRANARPITLNSLAKNEIGEYSRFAQLAELLKG